MRGLWLEDGELVLRSDLSEPSRSPDDVTVSVRCAGICGTDLAMTDGYADMTGTPGHEFVGDVIEGPDEWLGKRVVAEINVACGACDLCRRGYPTHCLNRSVVGIRGRPGAFAERLAVPLANLHALPEHLPDEIAVLVEPLAAAFEIVRQVDIDRGSRVLVIGAGRLAQLITQVVLGFTTEVSVLARSASRAAQFAPLPVEVVDAAVGMYDMVIEASGNPAALSIAVDHVRPRGTLVLKSTYNRTVAIDTSRLVVNEISLIGSRCGPFETAIEALACDSINLSCLPFERYSLDAFERAFERARSPDVYKVLIDPARA